VKNIERRNCAVIREYSQYNIKQKTIKRCERHIRVSKWKKRKIDHLLLSDGPSLSFYTISDIQAEDAKYLGIYLDRRLTRKKYG